MGETIKIHYEPFHGKVLFKTPKYNEYFKENFREFDALEFIAEVTAHIPPKHKQYIRHHGYRRNYQDTGAPGKDRTSTSQF